MGHPTRARVPYSRALVPHNGAHWRRSRSGGMYVRRVRAGSVIAAQTKFGVIVRRWSLRTTGCVEPSSHRSELAWRCLVGKICWPGLAKSVPSKSTPCLVQAADGYPTAWIRLQPGDNAAVCGLTMFPPGITTGRTPTSVEVHAWIAVLRQWSKP